MERRIWRDRSGLRCGKVDRGRARMGAFGLPSREIPYVLAVRYDSMSRQCFPVECYHGMSPAEGEVGTDLYTRRMLRFLDRDGSQRTGAEPALENVVE